MQQEQIEYLTQIVGDNRIKINEAMSKHTTFRVGGEAACMIFPKDTQCLQDAIHYLKQEQIPYYILGNGSNLLVSDAGYDGVMIHFGSNYDGYEFLHDSCDCAVDKNYVVYVKAQAGMLLGRLGSVCAEYSLTGFEFAAGIPGTVGGAVVMNAGAYGGELKDILVSATVMDAEGNIVTLSDDELELGYRTSIIQKKDYIVLEATFALRAGAQTEIRAKMQELAQKRRDKQPLEYPSAGSTFKRPQGYFAAKLIEDAGLKGYQVGGAQVSEKHAGFVINKDHATAADIIALTDAVHDKVLQEFGVELELEVRKIGF